MGEGEVPKLEEAPELLPRAPLLEGSVSAGVGLMGS